MSVTNGPAEDPSERLRLRGYKPWNPAEQRGPIANGAAYGAMLLFPGVYWSGVKATWDPSTRGFADSMFKYKHIPAGWAAFGASYGLTTAALANFRQRNDGWNDFWGGFVASSIGTLFSRQRQLPVIISVSILTGSAFGIYSWSGGVYGWQTPNAESTGAKEKKPYTYPFQVPLEDFENVIGYKVPQKAVPQRDYKIRVPSNANESAAIWPEDEDFAREAAGVKKNEK